MESSSTGIYRRDLERVIIKGYGRFDRRPSNEEVAVLVSSLRTQRRSIGRDGSPSVSALKRFICDGAALRGLSDSPSEQPRVLMGDAEAAGETGDPLSGLLSLCRRPQALSMSELLLAVRLAVRAFVATFCTPRAATA